MDPGRGVPAAPSGPSPGMSQLPGAAALVPEQRWAATAPGDDIAADGRAQSHPIADGWVLDISDGDGFEHWQLLEHAHSVQRNHGDASIAS